MELSCDGRVNGQPVGLTHCLDKRDHPRHPAGSPAQQFPVTVTPLGQAAVTVTVEHLGAWPVDGTPVAEQIWAAALNALQALPYPVTLKYVTRMSVTPDRTEYTYGPRLVTLHQVARMIRDWQTDGAHGDLDAALEEQLTGSVIWDGTRSLTVTGVTNAGFNGQAITGTTDTGHPAVFHVR